MANIVAKKYINNPKKLEAFLRSEDPIYRGGVAPRVGEEAPQEKIVRQLTNLKNFSNDPKNYKPILPTRPFKKAEIPNVKQFDQFDESTKPYNQKKELDKVDGWEVAKKIAKSPQEIRKIRDTINQSVRNLRSTKHLSKDEFKFVDKDLLASLEPPKPRPEILDWDWRLAPWQDYPEDDDAPAPPKLARHPFIKTTDRYARLLKELETKPDPDLDKGLGYLLGTKNGY